MAAAGERPGDQTDEERRTGSRTAWGCLAVALVVVVVIVVVPPLIWAAGILVAGGR